MLSHVQSFEYLYQRFFGPRFDEWLRSKILLLALLGFAVHLILWALYNSEYSSIQTNDVLLLQSPLAALYTPFSILLFYEVYELIRAIPSSFSVAVGKQFEVVTLLIVRDVFKNLSLFEPSVVGENYVEIALIVAECVAFLFLFYTALRFHSYGSGPKLTTVQEADVERFISYKKAISFLLFIIYILVALFSFIGWVYLASKGQIVVSKEIFFLDFFTFLIVVDIFILLFSYKLSHDFVHLARNTGFVLSTVILRVAISSKGFPAVVLFILSGILGLAILRITNRDWNPPVR